MFWCRFSGPYSTAEHTPAQFGEDAGDISSRTRKPLFVQTVAAQVGHAAGASMNGAGPLGYTFKLCFVETLTT